MKDTKEILIKENLKVKKKLKSRKIMERGITLIALVVTIIILLILTGVTLNMTMSDNGLFKKAKEAVDKYEKTSEDEQRQIAMAEAMLNHKNTKYEDKNGEKVTIPAGFAVSSVEGENTVEKGLVIIDSEGNEFVWVPLIGNLENIAGYKDGKYLTNVSIVEPCDRISDDAPERQEYDKMKASIEKYGGFYIGRYEAGAEGGTLVEELKEDGTKVQKWSESPKLVCKKGMKVYNWIKWGNSMIDDSGGAVEVSRNFRKGKDWEKSVTSTLIYGVQWTATMKFIDSNYGNGLFDKNSFAKCSTGMGNYNEDENKNEWKNTLTETGKIPKYAIKNIYDLGGNVTEWTMESDGPNCRWRRRWSLR